jgi:PAS domain S-box-containing protein
MDTLFLEEYRCKCGKLLLKGAFFSGVLEVKCKKCGEMNLIRNAKLKDDEKHYLLLIDSKGTIVNASDSACDVLGYAKDEIVGKHFTGINTTIPEDMNKRFLGPMSLLNDENHFVLETFHTQKNGESIPVTVYIRLYRLTNEEKAILLSVRKRDIDANARHEEMDATGLSASSCEFYYDIDRNGCIEYVSPAVQKLTGIFSHDSLGKYFLDSTLAVGKENKKKIFEYFSSRKLQYKVDNCKTSKGNFDFYFTAQFDELGTFSGYRVLGWKTKES